MKNLFLFFAFSLHAFGTSNSLDGDLRFEGRCIGTERNPPREAWFSIDPTNEGYQTLDMIEVDGLGNEVTTKITVSFRRWCHDLTVQFNTDLQAPYEGHISTSPVTVGTQVRGLFPLKLGNQVECEGTVISLKK